MKPIIQYLFLALSIFFVACSNQDQHVASTPNFLLILTDDMGFGDYSMAGNPNLKTPHLDALAGQSVSFSNFYVSSVCAPTRASLLTGQYHQRVDVHSVTNGFETMNPEAVTMAELLKERGYKTGIFGKWHLGEYYPSLPNAQGFDEYVGFRTGHTENYFDPVLEHNGHQQAYKGHITEVLTNEALDFMRKHKEEPFFCYLAYNAPHTPLQVDSTYFVKYLEEGLNDRTARIYGLIEQLDENIGRIMEELDAQQMLEKTVVVFMSDNGPISGWKPPQEAMRYNKGLRDQKFTVYEGGVRTQCFWSWKGAWNPKEISSTVGAHIDVLPTFLEIINAHETGANDFDGVSLLGVLNGENADLDRIYFDHYSLDNLQNPDLFPGGIAIQGKWKMKDGIELYDLQNDPEEKQNVAEEHPEIMTSLNEAYEAYYTSIRRGKTFQPKPVRIGFAEENPVHIQPHHGKATGNVQFLNPGGRPHPTGVDGSYLGNWKARGDSITWKLQSERSGAYNIALPIRGSWSNASLSVFANDEKLAANLRLNFDELEWQNIEMGSMILSKDAETTFGITLNNITEGDKLEIREVILSFE